jgi:hypothetical protein
MLPDDFQFRKTEAVYPILLAGTINVYSNSAIPQLARTATYHGRSARFRKCAYHANVMNTFEHVSKIVVMKRALMRRV